MTLISCQNKSDPRCGDGSIHLAIRRDPQTFDPRLSGDMLSGFVISQIYDGLTRIDYQGQAQLSLAKHLTISSDRLTYTFFIRDARWSNGDRLTAYDFARTWREILAPNSLSPNIEHLFVIKGARDYHKGLVSNEALGIKTPNEWTLQVQLEHPITYFLELLSMDTMLPVHPAMMSYDEDPISCGPFIIKEWTKEQRLVLEKNPRYWDSINVHLEKIVLENIADEHTAVSLYDKGELDWIGTPLCHIPLQEYQRLHPSLKTNYSQAYWILLNTQKFPFNNKKIREAFKLALSRDTITYALRHSKRPSNMRYFKPARSLILPCLSPKPRNDYFEDKSGDFYQKFIDGMEELKIPTLESFPKQTLYYNSGDIHRTVAAMLKEEWRKELGVDVELQQEDWAGMLRRLRHGDFTMARFGWQMNFHDPISFLELFTTPTDDTVSNNNFTRWHNLEYEKLVEEIRALPPGIERQHRIKQAEKILMEDSPFIPIMFSALPYIKSDRLHNIVVTDHGRLDLKWAFLED